MHPATRFRVADNLFFDRVPLQWSIEPISDIRQMGTGRRSMGSLDMTERQLSRLDTMQEVAEDSARAFVIRDVDVRRGNLARSRVLFRYFAFRATEVDDSTPAAAMMDRLTVCELEDKIFIFVVWRDNLGRTC